LRNQPRTDPRRGDRDRASVHRLCAHGTANGRRGAGGNVPRAVKLPKIDPEKANRPAWLVILVGEHPSCDVDETCPSVPTREEITLDRDTGGLLGVVVRSAFAEPRANDVPCPPDQCPPE